MVDFENEATTPTETFQDTEPTIFGAENTLTPIAMEVELGVAWKRQTDTTETGRSISSSSGSEPPRVSINGIIVRDQKQTLQAIRNNNDTVRVVSETYTGQAEFDQLRLTRTDEEDRLNLDLDGRNVTQPMFTFQVQTKANGKQEQQETATQAFFN